jgi:DHA1 family tetracycline resistance protein-like MFS transporter
MSEDSAPARPSGGRAAFAFILVTIVLDMMAGSLIGPVLPRLVSDVSGRNMANVAQVFGALLTVFFVMQLFAGPIQGALSDRFGRRPVILASTFGLALDYVIVAMAPNVAWLFVGRLISGAMAGGFSAAYAYVADITPPEKQARRYGLVTAAMNAGFAVGPIVGGFLGEVNVRAPFWIAAGLGLVGGLWGVFVLKESLPADQRSPLKLHNLHPLGVIVSMWREFPALRLWGLALFLMNFGVSGINAIFSIYTTYRFAWGPEQIGLYSSSLSVEGVLVQSLAVGPIVRWLGDRRALIWGLALQTLAMFAAGFAMTGLQFWLAVGLMMLGGFAGPAMTATLNSTVGPGDLGRLSGANRTVYSLAAVGSPAIFSMIFAATGGQPKSLLAGTPVYVSTVLVALSLVLIVRATRPARIRAAEPA